MLHCLPFSPDDFDTHVVSIVYISDLGKWIMLDASNNRFFMDSDKNILSPMEIRSRLACNDDIECNMSDDNYFKSLQNNTFGPDLQTKQKTILRIMSAVFTLINFQFIINDNVSEKANLKGIHFSVYALFVLQIFS